MSTKVTKLVCYLLFRILLPITLLTAAVVRFNGLSFLYAVFLLITPLLSVPNVSTIKGLTGIYLKLLLVLSAAAALTQIIFHVTLVAIATDTEPYGSMFPNCSHDESIARQIAVQRLDQASAVHITRLAVTDLIVFIITLVVFLISYFLLKREENQTPSDLPVIASRSRRRRGRPFLDFVGEFILNVLIGASGIILPSVFSAVYFLSFLSIATLWALYYSMGRKFAFYRGFLLIYCGLHILTLHLYQFQFFQDGVPHDSFIARLLGLTGVIKTDCNKPWILSVHSDVKWEYYVNPGILLLLYWVLAFETRHYCHRKNEPLVESDIVKDKKRKKKRQPTSLERQTGSIMFSDLAYGDPDALEEEHLVDDGENQNYSSIEASNKDEQTGATPISDNETDEENVTESRKRERSSTKRSPFISIFVYIMKQSYVLLLIAMMAWSITFHSWLTFVLLLGACILWMLPDSRRACLIISPLITFYGLCLLIAQFVFSLNLTEDELPRQTGDLRYREIGLMDLECYELALQVFFVLFFWLTMRQYMRERHTSQNNQQGLPLRNVQRQTSTLSDFITGGPIDSDTVDGYDSNSMKTMARYVWLILCKYWIFVCVGMLLLISIQDVVVYRIIYMFLFLYFILAFQFSYIVWRKTMFLFWWVVIIYSMAVLIMIYTYQFDAFPQYWSEGTGFSNATLSDIGLERYDTAGLFMKLLTPTAFLIIVILQIHYFHKPFLAYSSLTRYKKDEPAIADPNVTDYTTDETGYTTTDSEHHQNRRTKRWKRRMSYWFRKLWAFSSEIWASVSALLWRLSEVHFFKIVVFIIMLVSVTEVSAISAVYVLLMAVFIPLSKCHIVLSHIVQFWTSLVLLAKMLYQLRLVKKDYWITNCTSPMDVGNSTLSSMLQNGTEVDNALWVGLAKISKLDVTISYYISNYLLILMLIAFESIVRYHQIQRYRHEQIIKPKTGIVFPEIKREDADKGLKNCIMYFFNYGFYKFGLEICYITTAATISIRADAYAVLYAIFLGILLLLSRRGNARIWPLYTIVLAVLLPLQYLSCVGFPLGLCLKYPWKHETTLDQNLEQWLFLPDYAYPPHAFKLLADFVQLLFVCLQWRVFRIENIQEIQDEGGDNQDILPEVEANTPIPDLYNDFTASTSSYLDVTKYFVFEYMFWVTLSIVFLTGLTRINLFSMGYVIAVFCFMWYGQEFLLKPLRKLLRGWNILLGYTFCVLFAKAALQLVGCVYIKHLYENQCWLIQLLGINCLMSDISITPPANVKCVIEEDNTGLAWDVVCFVFLLLQRRIYSSHYFRHVVDEIEAQHRLASRGAQYIHRINIREVNRQKAAEEEILLNIKKKMKSLKEKQGRLKKNYVEPEEHYRAIRSGDYYLFDEDSDEEEAPDQTDSLRLGKQSPEDKDVRLGPFQVVSTAMDSGPQAAIDKAASHEKIASDGTSSPSTSQKKVKSTETLPDDEQETDDDGGELTETEETAKRWGSFFITLLKSIGNWIINLFNRISRNYRLVAKKLEKEMKLEKDKIQSEKQHISVEEKARKASSSSEPDDSDGGVKPDAGAVSDSDLLEVRTERPMDNAVSSLSLDEQLIDDDDYIDDPESEFEKNQPILYRLLVATYYVIVSRTDLLCYFLMILNQMIYACLISLPLPLMVFLWGMLSIPRPTKTFWITVITYTEALVVIKYLFQFSFFPWNDVAFTDDPFWPPRIIGIEQKSNYASLDLVLLLALFIHRSLLKRYGLWRDAGDIEADLARAGEKELSPPTSPRIEEVEPLGMEEAECSSTQVQSGSDKADDGKKPPSKVKQSLKKCLRPIKEFYHQVTQSQYVATQDVYAPMFLCDFITFIIVVFGYWAFGPAQTSGGGDVTSYLSENRVPVPFLVMLITQFLLIIVDRALFLRKNVIGKFIFQIILVVVIHIWMFFVLPAVTKRSFYDNVPAQLWYFTKCIYFGLSAYQIRCGYPTRILGNFLTKKYNYLNLFLFKGFLAIPFLLELRALMDWIWTDTTLALGSWLQMEDIYANIFVLKCWRHAEATYPTPRGNKRKAVIKYGVGGLLLFLIIFVIWFPLVLFSFANTVYVPNPPFQCKASVTVAGFQPLLIMNAQNQSIRQLSSTEYSQLQKRYIRNRDASAFLSNYEQEDISVTQLNGTSTALWGISPPSVSALITLLNSQDSMRVEFSLEFSRESTSGASELISHMFSRELDAKTKKQLLNILNGTAGNDKMSISELFPRYLRLSSKGRAIDVPSLLQFGDVQGNGYSNISLVLLEDERLGNLSDFAQWWEADEILLPNDMFNPTPDKQSSSSQLYLLTFNDRRAPAGFSIITGYGIIGLYLSFILLIGRFLRMALTGQLFTIMFRELPNVDKILTLCLNIYLVREMKEFRLEEDLYSKIVFLYRSPETLIRWTAYPQETPKLKTQ